MPLVAWMKNWILLHRKPSGLDLPFFFKEDMMAFKLDLIIYVKVYILGWLW